MSISRGPKEETFIFIFQGNINIVHAVQSNRVITVLWIHSFNPVVLYSLLSSGCQSVRSSTRLWSVSPSTTTTSCCSTRWTSPSLCSSAWSPLRSAPNPSVSSGTTPYCEHHTHTNTHTHTHKADDETGWSWVILILFIFVYISVLDTAAGRQRAVRWFSETTPTSAVSVITWPASPCSWTSPGGRWVTSKHFTFILNDTYHHASPTQTFLPFPKRDICVRMERFFQSKSWHGAQWEWLWASSSSLPSSSSA